MKKVIVRSENQSGGITAGEIASTKALKSKKLSLGKVASIATIITLIMGVLTFLGIDDMFDKENVKADEVYNVKSNKQSGGITAGKIVNIIIDKESLGIREPLGLYQNGTKVGVVKGFNANEAAKTFTIGEIEFDTFLRDFSVVFQPYEFQKHKILITHIENLVSMMPPGATGVRGNILGKSE